jgi:hypothetical protein
MQRHLGLAMAGVAGCSLFVQSGPTDLPGFTYSGVPVKCLRDLAPAGATTAADASKLAIDTMLSAPFEDRLVLVLSDPAVRHGQREPSALTQLSATGIRNEIEKALTPGFSIGTISKGPRVNASDGYNVGDCGRMVFLNRRKLTGDPKTSRDVDLWAGTIAHEIAHVSGFLHDTQAREGNSCTIPHLTGDVAEWVAFERTHAATDAYHTWEVTCSAFAKVCAADPVGRCVVERRFGQETH